MIKAAGIVLAWQIAGFVFVLAQAETVAEKTTAWVVFTSSAAGIGWLIWQRLTLISDRENGSKDHQITKLEAKVDALERRNDELERILIEERKAQ